MTPAPRSALVIGGGLAGISAALHLRDAGLSITLLESRDRLGGRATSFTDPATNRTVDNCQHVLMGSCTNLIDLYRRLGVLDRIRWHDEIYFASRGGRIDVMRPSAWLPSPLHYTPSLLGLRTIPSDDRFALPAILFNLLRTPSAELTPLTFLDWLKKNHASPALIDRFLAPIITSALNLTPDRASAAAAAHVFAQGFATHRNAGRIGIPDCPLVDLYSTAAQTIGDVRLNHRATRIHGNSSIESVESRDGQRLSADIYILALPFESLSALFSPALLAADARLTLPANLEFSPILGVHLWFNQPITTVPCLALVEHDVQWFFFKDHGRHAHAVISAADEWMDLDSDTITARVLADLRDVCPGSASAASPSDVRVIKEKRATFAPTPGSEKYRPSAAGSIPNLFLAGDYCQTGWPATMEGAVRSGALAAAASLGIPPHSLLAPDLPASTLARILGLVPPPPALP